MCISLMILKINFVLTWAFKGIACLCIRYCLGYTVQEIRWTFLPSVFSLTNNKWISSSCSPSTRTAAWLKCLPFPDAINCGKNVPSSMWLSHMSTNCFYLGTRRYCKLLYQVRSGVHRSGDKVDTLALHFLPAV